ncbi:DUF6274 family protein [Streptomyces sp. NPDC001381]|uniref:DUF6274 family protein n=1 Tax=Streptomyces sp. NPDC001381 TaxID=3364567 RepID=UPI00368C0E6E
MAAAARHETRALLRAHLSAASSYGHLTRHCPICHRLLRLAMDGAPRGTQAPAETLDDVLEDALENTLEDALEDESPSTA